MPRGDEKVVVRSEVLAPVEQAASLVQPGELTPQVIEKAKQFAALSRELRLSALNATREKDWIDMDGTPYLLKSGCNQLFKIFRIRTKNVRTEKVEEGSEYTIIVTGEAMSEILDPGGWVEVIGAASSTDKFLTKGGRIRAQLGDVIKKAHTNFLQRALQVVAGIGGITWEELAELGIKREKVQRVEHAKADDTDVVWVQVNYKDKDKLRDLVRERYGVAPRWDGQRKAWGIPRDAANLSEVRAMIINPPPAQEKPPAPAEEEPEPQPTALFGDAV